MTSFVLVHGAGDSGWAWSLLQEELRARGHESVAPDLPSAARTLDDYVAAVETASASLTDTSDLVVVGHSLGGFTAPLVADRLDARGLVLLAAMVPAPGESVDGWWSNTGYAEAARVASERDGGLTGNSDDMVAFYNGVPDEVAHAARQHAVDQAEEPMRQPWPLEAWPDVATRFVLCRDDRFFPADFFRALVPDRLGFTPEEIDGGHCVMLGDPAALADLLLA